MEIGYRYMQPKELPIMEAVFRPTGGHECAVAASGGELRRVNFCFGNSFTSFNKPDLAEFISLLQKFHDQMEG